MPVMLIASCAADPSISWRSQNASPRARLPAAGTGGTLMKTPTMVAERETARARAPAAPASSATTKDHWSGCQMKPVLGRARVTSSTVTRPAQRANSASSAITAIAKANENSRSRRPRPIIPGRRSAMPALAAATALYSGPTTIAPTTSTAESVITAIEARATARTRNRWYDTVGTAPASACASTASQITASSGCPGAAASRRLARSNGVPVGVVTTTPPSAHRPIRSRSRSSSPAFSPATSHSTRSPDGSSTTPSRRVRFVIHARSRSSCTTGAVSLGGEVSRKCTTTARSVRWPRRPRGLTTLPRSSGATDARAYGVPTRGRRSVGEGVVAPRSSPRPHLQGFRLLEVLVQRTLCSDLPAATPGEPVRLQGWVHRRRELAALTFLVVRDRSGLAQVVVRGGEVPPEETTVEVVGTATANAQAPGGIEVTDPVIVPLTEPAATPPIELWRPTIAAGLPTMLDHAPVTWRHPVQRARWELAAASVRG